MNSRAYAKINLSLDVTGRREDGYHTLRTVLQGISLCDEVELSDSEGGISVSCDEGDVPCGPGNTVWKAAIAFFRSSGIRGRGVRFRIWKRIPRQAGLGGGSADAAAALRLLNRRFHTAFSPGQLQKIGLQAGADVPFCVLGGTALAEGIGEVLTPLSPLPDCWIVICKPPTGISTREAYLAFDRVGKHSNAFTESMEKAVRGGSLEKIGESLENAFETVLFLPEVRKIKRDMISLGALGSCMTGSGSAVFGLFDSKAAAFRCLQFLKENYPDSFLCRPSGKNIFPERSALDAFGSKSGD